MCMCSRCILTRGYGAVVFGVLTSFPKGGSILIVKSEQEDGLIGVCAYLAPAALEVVSPRAGY